MIRAANTGVSAVIDAYGRVLASLEMEHEGVIDHALPPPRAATPYARWHDWTLLVLLTILAMFVLSGANVRPDVELAFNGAEGRLHMRDGRVVICTFDV